MNVNTVVCMDALEFLRGLEDACVDLVLTSPPYNMRTNTNGAKPTGTTTWKHGELLKSGYLAHDDAVPHEQYTIWQRDILTECMRAIDNTGAIFYNHKWRIQGGLLDMRSEIVEGFPVRQVIIWDRGTSLNHCKSFFAPQYEVIYVIAKSKFYIDQSATKHGDVWRIPPETSTDHPAPFPLVLAERVIRSTSARIVCDPFMGRGTTAKAAQRLGSNYIGCDLSAEYVNDANRWLADPIPVDMFDTIPKSNDEPKPEQLTLIK